MHVEENVAIPLVALSQNVRLVHTADPAVVVVEPTAAVDTVHVGDVVARVGGAAVVADDAHQPVRVVAGQVHRARRLVVLDTELGQVRLGGGVTGVRGQQAAASREDWSIGLWVTATESAG